MLQALVSKETERSSQWGSKGQKFGIKQVDKVEITTDSKKTQKLMFLALTFRLYSLRIRAINLNAPKSSFATFCHG